MAKLNYDRDVKGILKTMSDAMEKKCGKALQIRNPSTVWQLFYKNNDGTLDMIYEGTLREVYCYLKGMEIALEAK